jgi:membrane protease subunit (stomatin/prohibitin family)
MGTNNAVFLEVIEWFDDTGKKMVHRIPETGSGEIKYGAQLTIRESQAGVFFYKGKAVEAFPAGRHTLITGNIPILTKIVSLPWGLTSPLRAEVYFVNLKTFTNLKWGTRDPVAFKDKELGLIRLRAFGVFNVQVVQPVLFINRLVGTQGMFTTSEIEEYLNLVIVSRFNDLMGETIHSLLDLPSKYDELSKNLTQRLHDDFTHFGLSLTHLYMNSITPPPEVQKSIDDRSRLGLFEDMNKLLQMKAAMAVEKASEGDGPTNTGMGMGVGLMMPAMFSQFFTQAGQKQQQPQIENITCSECKNPISLESKFCPHCGHQQLIFSQCLNCKKNLTPNAKFCSRCGHRVKDKVKPIFCKQCGTENLADSEYCNNCGEKL